MDIPAERPVRSPEIPQSPEADPDEGQPLANDQTLPINPDATESEDAVEEASDESFPASDPPRFTRSTTKD